MKKDLVSFQWEKSWTQPMNTQVYYFFGIERSHDFMILALPFISNHFNKIIYLYKESNVSQTKAISMYFSDGNVIDINLIPNVVTELFIPCKRFRLRFKAKVDEDTDIDIMLKFLKG